MSKHELLRKLAAVRETERGIVPDQAWVLRTRERLMDHAHRTHAQAAAPLSFAARLKLMVRHFAPTKLFQFMRAPVLASLSIFATVLGGSLVSVSAAERSVPGDFLYPIKLAGEQTRLAFTSDKVERIKLKTDYVERRVEEIKAIASNQDGASSDLLREAAKGLKRDLDTVKNQLKDVKKETAQKSAAVARLVDSRSNSVAQELKNVRGTVPQDVKPSMAEAEAAALQTGVSAVGVLIDAQDKPEGKDIISDEDVTKAIESKVNGIRATLEGTAERLRAVSPTSTISGHSASTGTSSLPATSSTVLTMLVASSSAFNISAASATLQEVRVLLGEHRLDEVTDKLHEAASAAAQAEVTFDLAASGTVPLVPVVPATSTQSGTGTTTTSNQLSGASPP